MLHLITLTDLERWDATGPVFLADLHTYARTVWPTATKFGMITNVWEWRVSNRSNTSPSQGQCSSVPKCFGTITYCPCCL